MHEVDTGSKERESVGSSSAPMTRKGDIEVIEVDVNDCMMPNVPGKRQMSNGQVAWVTPARRGTMLCLSKGVKGSEDPEQVVRRDGKGVPGLQETHSEGLEKACSQKVTKLSSARRAGSYAAIITFRR